MLIVEKFKTFSTVSFLKLFIRNSFDNGIQKSKSIITDNKISSTKLFSLKYLVSSSTVTNCYGGVYKVESSESLYSKQLNILS